MNEYVLGAMAILLLGVLLYKARNRAAVSPLSPSTRLHSVILTDCHPVGSASGQTPLPRRGIPENSAYICDIKACLRELGLIGVQLCAQRLHEVISSKFESLSAYLVENQEKSSPEVFWNAIAFAKTTDLHAEMEQVCMEVMEFILAYYSTELLPMIFDSASGAAQLRPKYALSQAMEARESLDGQALLKRNLGPIYAQLGELARVQGSMGG